MSYGWPPRYASSSGQRCKLFCCPPGFYNLLGVKIQGGRLNAVVGPRILFWGLASYQAALALQQAWLRMEAQHLLLTHGNSRSATHGMAS